MSKFEQNLEKYAELAVKLGVNLQEDQTLHINAPITAVDFVRRVVKHAYDAGARTVHVNWDDEQLSLIKLQKAKLEALAEFPSWKARAFEEMAEDGAAFLSIYAPNPDLLKDIDAERIAVANKAHGMAMKKFSEYITTSKVSWSLISVPTPEWAGQVFPDLGEEKSIEKLWEYIFMVTRVNLEDPVHAWHEHVKNIQSKVQFLNSKNFKKLHYRAPGTDLTVELPEGHVWIGAGEHNQQGVFFQPNMPTEEVFTVPKRDGVNGVVTSTKPLNYSGKLIENFSLKFENGRIVEIKAETGYETLKKLVETDEGSHYLGEVALVPHDSPISNLNVVFRNTLFDENASNHLAIGTSYPICLKNGVNMNQEELVGHGANWSIVHEDFMIGSKDMDIDGELNDGTLVPVFRNGNWAI